MRIHISTNALEVSGFMRDLFRDQLPFAVQQAVRRTALDFQAGQREHQRAVFTVRRKRFSDRAVKIRDWPTKQRPEAIVRIEPPGGSSRANILIDHEEGGLRPPPPGQKARAIEREARPAPHRIAPKRLRPKQLEMRKVSDGGPKGATVWQGPRRTFMIRWPDGSGAIFRRTGPGKSGTFLNTEVLWSFTPRGVMLDPRLEFHENAERIVAERWPENMAAAWDRALRTAR